jgi:hypothetical protein
MPSMEEMYVVECSIEKVEIRIIIRIIRQQGFPRPLPTGM